jgi:hypothetical protein
MADHSSPSPSEQAESRAAQALEQLVAKPSFGVLLAQTAENVAAITRIGSDLADLVLRNLRIAGRADITRLPGSCTGPRPSSSGSCRRSST